MANKDYTSMNYQELIDSGKENSDLSALAAKFEEDSCPCKEEESNESEPTIVIIKESSITDENAKLPYQNKEQTIYAHALVHLWWNMPEKTKWSRLQISREHTRIVAKLVNNSWGHMMWDSLDDSLPQSLMKDFNPSTGIEESTIKPTKIIIVNNSKTKKAPIVEIDQEEIGSIKVILHQSVFESSVEDIKDNENDQECRKFLNNDLIDQEEKNGELYLRINAMHEGTWNYTEISREELEKAASTYAGRLVIEGHKWDDPERSIGEVLKASVKFDGELQRYYLEVLAKITRKRAIEEVKAGRYKFVSVGASMQARCNICGMTVSEGCNHLRGVEYDTIEHGRLLCVKIASEIIFEELSFINVPAARWARVLEELDSSQVRELLAASKSRGTFSIEVESENTRILPTLDEFLSLQEESIIKLYNRKEEDINMAQDTNKDNELKLEAPGAAPGPATDAATPENTIKKPEEITPPPVQEETPGNVSKVEVTVSNPVDGGKVETGTNDASKKEVPAPANSDSNPNANESSVAADKNPLDGGTVDTTNGNAVGDRVESNPIVNSDTVTEENSVQSDTLTLTNEQIDEMDVTSIYEYAKSNKMDSLVNALVLANEPECKNVTIDVKSSNEAILVHALLHMWLDDLTLTNWNKESIDTEHDRIVKVLEGFGIGHENESEVVNVETAVVESSSVTVEKKEETIIVEDNSKTIELLNTKVEGLSKELDEIKIKYNLAVEELKTVKDSNEHAIYTLKFDLAKSNRLNKKMESDIIAANKLVNEKTSEIEILNSKLDSYNKKEFNSVLDQIVSIKTDMNKYADKDAIDKDREKFSKMSIESLKAILDEISAAKENSLKNTVAHEFGLGEVSTKVETESKTENKIDGNSEIQNYQKEGEEGKKDITNNETTTQKEVVEDSTKNFIVRDGSVLSLVKKSLNFK